jgi:hypothetical protein
MKLNITLHIKLTYRVDMTSHTSGYMVNILCIKQLPETKQQKTHNFMHCGNGYGHLPTRPEMEKTENFISTYGRKQVN